MWTPALIQKLHQLWSEKTEAGADVYSASQIGTILGMSKNAVVGKAHRERLPPRISPINRTPGTAKRIPRQQSREAAAIKIEAEKFIETRPARKLFGSCTWCSGSKEAWIICDEPKSRGPFCEAHARVGLITRASDWLPIPSKTPAQPHFVLEAAE